MNPRFFALATLAACGSPSSDLTTYTEVGPVLEKHCVSCHQDGGVAPFPMTTFEEAGPWATASAKAVAARTMPPYLVVDDGTCAEITGDNWLGDDEIELLVSWADDGAVEGDGFELVPPEVKRLSGELSTVQTPDFTPEIVGGQYAEFDEYRCFMIDMPKTGYLTGYEVVPGNAELVHHVIGQAVDLDATGRGGNLNRDIIDDLRGDGTREGWPCFNGAGRGVSTNGEILVWAPGQGPVEYPDGIGMKVEKGQKLVVQVHYNMSDPEVIGQSDRSSINLRIDESVTREAYMSLPDLFLAGYSTPSVIPAGQERTSVNWSLQLSDLGVPVALDMVAIMPHMHQRGREMHVWLERDGQEDTCVVDVPAWDFNWQRIYMYEEPILIRPTDTMHVECVYDTSDDTEATTPGWGTRNEMCLPGILVTLPR